MAKAPDTTANAAPTDVQALTPVQTAAPAQALTTTGGIDYGADAGDLGFGTNDLVVPFIRILQSNSPQLARGNAKYIPSARAGDFYNTVTADVFSGEDGIYVLPIAFQRSYTEWKPRDTGGGLVADYGPDASVLQRCSQDDKKRWWTQNGTIIQEAGHYYVFQLDIETGLYTMAVMPFTSTQWKKSRTWNTVMSGMMVKTARGMQPMPMFANVYHFTTVGESNDSGDWLGYKIRKWKATHEIKDGPDIYDAARSFKMLVAEQKVTAKHDDDVADGEGAAPQPSQTPNRPSMDDDIPF